jgi:hypothetical protein
MSTRLYDMMSCALCTLVSSGYGDRGSFYVAGLHPRGHARVAAQRA